MRCPRFNATVAHSGSRSTRPTGAASQPTTMLDIFTLFVGLLCAHTALAIAIAVVLGRRVEPGQWPGLRAWNNGMFLIAVGWAIRFSGATLPELIGVPVGLALVSFGFGMYLRGIRQFCGRSTPWLWVLGPAVLVGLQQAIWIDHFAPRAVFVNLVYGLQLLALMPPVIRASPLACMRTRNLFLFATALGAFSVMARAALVVVDDAALPSLMTPHPVNALSLLVTLVAGVLLQAAVIAVYMQRSGAESRRLAHTDPLTGLLNRRAFEAAKAAEVARARRTGQALAVVMIDVDGFKSLNDRHGHAAGDGVLRRLGQEVTAALRLTDIAARIGGDEFCLVLAATAAEAMQVAERVRGLVSQARGPGDVHATVSLGVSALADDETSLDDAIARADQALYLAKQQGRNQVRSAAAEAVGMGRQAAGAGR
jgi:diguanylate cyclase (GGDEF)-like protein